MVWGIDSPFAVRRHSGAMRSIEPGLSIEFTTSRFRISPLRGLSGMTVISSEITAIPLPHQFLHRAFETFDGDREHALRKQPANEGGGFRIVPVPLRHRIEPHRMRIGAGDALEPDRSGL